MKTKERLNHQGTKGTKECERERFFVDNLNQMTDLTFLVPLVSWWLNSLRGLS